MSPQAQKCLVEITNYTFSEFQVEGTLYKTTIKTINNKSQYNQLQINLKVEGLHFLILSDYQIKPMVSEIAIPHSQSYFLNI